MDPTIKRPPCRRSAEQLGQLAGRLWLADEKTLYLRAAFQPELAQLLDSFDAFGGGGDAEGAAEPRHRAYDRD